MSSAIGFQGPLSGPFGWLGSGLVSAIEQALPADGTIRLVTADSAGSPEQPIAAARSLSDNADVVAVVGPTFSRETEVSAGVLEAAGIPFVLVVATKPELGTQGFQHFHRIVATDAVRGPLAAGFVLDTLESKRLALLHEDTETGHRVATFVAEALAERGQQEAVRRVFSRGACAESDIQALLDVDADATFFVGEAADAAVAVRTLHSAHPSMPFVTDDGARVDAFIESAGELAEGTIAVVPAAPLARADPGVAARLACSGEPVVFAAEAFQAASLLVSLIEEVGADRRSLAAALRDFDRVVAGRQIGFTAAGENRYQTFYSYRVSDGAWKPLRELAAPVAEVASAGRRTQ